MGVIDISPVVDLTARAGKELQDRYGEDAFIRTIGLVIEIDKGDTTQMVSAFSDDRIWAQRAFLDEAIECVSVGQVLQQEAEEDGST